jgi:hypothetical protein
MRLGPPRHPKRVVDLINPAAALAPAANVIMQLALPGVGYGVLESPVDSGNVYKHPFKRARTTGTYLAAAVYGTDGDRALIRREVDRVHALVRSTASSPVKYHAFDPKLQLWVASCLYRYYVDQHEFLYGPLSPEAADAIYQDARTLGTTLQVREGMWPADRVAFDEYWKRTLDELRIDEPVPPTPARRGGPGVPAHPTAAAGRSLQHVRDDGLPARRVPHPHEAGVDTEPGALVRPAADGAAPGRPGDSARRVAVRLPAVPVGHAVPRTARKTGGMTQYSRSGGISWRSQL